MMGFALLSVDAMATQTECVYDLPTLQTLTSSNFHVLSPASLGSVDAPNLLLRSGSEKTLIH